jgi:hypothetical protein
MNRILLEVRNGQWNATYIGPHAADIHRLMGTDTLPTSYTAKADGETVRAEIQRRNPGVFVELAP